MTLDMIPTSAITFDGNRAWVVDPEYTPAFIATLDRPCDSRSCHQSRVAQNEQ